MAERTRLSDVFVEMCVQYELRPGRDPETLRHTLAAVARELQEARAVIRRVREAADNGEFDAAVEALDALLPEGA